jgi:carbon-monoxide dehydrogenase large subunit
MGAKLVGARVKRIEDPRLLRGGATYVDDVVLPGMCHVAFVRSPHAHARIRDLDLSQARGTPGVVAVFTLKDLWPDPPTIPVLIPEASLLACPQYPMALDRVRYAGEAVAMVVATDRYLAEDAAELVRVDYEPLPAVGNVDAAVAEGAPLLHQGVPGNVAARWKQEKGDVESAFRGAHKVVKASLRMQRYTGVPMETCGIVAGFDRVSGQLTLWVSTQWPHILRNFIGSLTGLGEHRVRVILPEVGGGFGIKAELYPEELAVAMAAMKLGIPLKWIEDRREHLLRSVHAREMAFDLAIAVAEDGTILGLRGQVKSDQGAYVRTLGMVNPSLAGGSLCGPYRVPVWSIEVVCILTNKSPTSPYRGAGQPEATFARERLLDIAAEELGMDPATLRRHNLVRSDEMPYDTGLTSVEGPIVLDSGDYPALLEQALQRSGYWEVRRAQSSAGDRLRGVGISVYSQITGLGPYEGAEVRVDSGGRVAVVCGAAPQGQGAATALAQIVADELEVPLESISVHFGDTALIPYGVGTFASRTAPLAGAAAALAARKVKEKALQLAAHLLEADPVDLEWVDGAAMVRGVPSRRITLAQLAKAAEPGGKRPPGMEPELASRHYFETHSAPFAGGVHVAEVELDPETGRVEVKAYVVAHDAGTLINPLIVEGQIVGGVAQGLGGALLEELVYTQDGQLLTGSLMDYLLPTSMDVPRVTIEHMFTPTPLNPLGIKGLGEGGAIAAHAAVANAVADALRLRGARLTVTPASPDRILSLLRGT